MSGIKGRSGRRPKPLEEHLLAGTYRKDRHGPKPSAPGGTTPLTPIPSALLADLGESGRVFIASVWAEYASTAAGGWTIPDRALLRIAAQQHDRLAEARGAIARAGTLLVSRGGRSYANPWLRIEQQATRTLMDVMKQLGIGR